MTAYGVVHHDGITTAHVVNGGSGVVRVVVGVNGTTYGWHTFDNAAAAFRFAALRGMRVSWAFRVAP